MIEKDASSGQTDHSSGYPAAQVLYTFSSYFTDLLSYSLLRGLLLVMCSVQHSFQLSSGIRAVEVELLSYIPFFQCFT